MSAFWSASSSTGPSVAKRRAPDERTSWIIAVYACSITLLSFLAVSEPLRHWFVIPVLLSGILITKDAVDWFRSEDDPLDPVGLFGLFGFHFFFLSYLLHVVFDFWWGYPYAPTDWRPWLGYAAGLNCVGLVAYRIVLGLYGKGRNERPSATLWQISLKRLPVLVAAGLGASAVLQYLLYQRFGGLTGMIDARLKRGVGENPLEGMGVFAVFAESFPVVLAIGITVLTRRSKLWRSPAALRAMLLVVFLSAVYFGGLKGSRSTIFFTLVWAGGMVHFWIRPISKKIVIIGPLMLFLFMNTYLLYKRGGVEGILNVTDAAAREEIMSGGIQGRPQLFILLHDFARADISALVLYLIHEADDYRYAMGRSYLGALFSVVPRAIWPDRPQALAYERSDLLFGRGSGVYVAYAIGLTGEASMNFGPVAVPLAFLLIAAVVLGVRRFNRSMPPGDGRRLLIPLLIILCFIVPMGEFQSVMYIIVKNGFVPFAIIFLASDRVRNPARQSMNAVT